MNKEFYITLFGGWFGLHKYMKKQIGMGLLYTFTAGLFCIGWIYDCVKSFKRIEPESSKMSKTDLIKWQCIVMNTNQTQLVATPQQLKVASKMYIENNVRILTDSLRLVNETHNPKIFFTRVEDVLECYNNLADLEEFYPTDTSPVNSLLEFENYENKLVHDFIQRYWYKTVSEAEKLKTEKAKENRLSKAKGELLSFSDKIDSMNIEYINTLA